MSRHLQDLCLDLAEHEDERVRDLAQGAHRLLIAYLTEGKAKRAAFSELESRLGAAVLQAGRVIVGE